MTLTKKVYGVCVAGLLAAGILFAAKGHGFSPQRRFDFLATRLSLTAAQKGLAQSIFDQSQEAAKPLREQLRQSHQDLAAAIKAGKPDAELTELSQRQSGVAGQLTAIRAKAFSRLYAQLTPEQKAKAEQIHQRIGARWERHAGM